MSSDTTQLRPFSLKLPPDLFVWLTEESATSGTTKQALMLAALSIFRGMPEEWRLAEARRMSALVSRKARSARRRRCTI